AGVADQLRGPPRGVPGHLLDDREQGGLHRRRVKPRHGRRPGRLDVLHRLQAHPVRRGQARRSVRAPRDARAVADLAGLMTLVSGFAAGLVTFVAARVLTGLGEGTFYSNDRTMV